MKELFKDILDLDDIQGVLFVSLDGKLVFEEFGSHPPDRVEGINWLPFISTLDGVREGELVFENKRLYVRKAESGYILVVMGDMALTEMLRLNCDILLPALEQTAKKPKGLGRFFKLK